jgi:hypothetical protein
VKALKNVAASVHQRLLNLARRRPDLLHGGIRTNSGKAAQWRAFLRRNTYADVPDSFSGVIKFLAGFLRPVTLSAIEKKPLDSIWHPGGPWASVGFR